MNKRLLDEAFNTLQSILINNYPSLIHFDMIPKEIQIENMIDPTTAPLSITEENVIDSDANVLYPKAYPKFAIIGTGIRLPGDIYNKDDFWKVMTEKKVITGLIPEDRWDRDEWYSEVEKPGTIQTVHGGFIENAFDFDNKYFGISQNEALDATPEQRWLCELTVETIEDANIDMDHFKGSNTGVFVGTSGMDYGSYVFSVPEKITKYTYSGIEPSIHANRVSYLFNLHGPSLSTNTACSSSMTALSIACNSMAAGDCEMAIVAGTNFFQAPANGVAYSQLRVVSKKGACRPFDIDADGYARLEGAAMVLLKPYEKAIRDNNKIYATILSTACNEDGKTSSLTTPSPEAQCELMKRVYDKGHIDPCTIDFIEAHGTGTSVGDPIEARSIGEAYGKVNKENGNPPIPIGSVKGNVGHGEYLSGIIGLIKGALVLHKNTIVPQTAFDKLNPKIDCKTLGIRIADKIETLPGEGRHRAAVNSFGFGGANANVILEEEPQLNKDGIQVLIKKNRKGETIPCPYVGFFSATNLRLLKETLKKWLKVPKKELLPMLYLNATTRTVLAHRIFIFVKDADEFYQTIRSFINDDSIRHGYKANDQMMYIETMSDRKKGLTMTFDEPLAAVNDFLGNETYYDICRELYLNNDYFANCINYCDRILRTISGRSLLEDYGLFTDRDLGKENRSEKMKKLNRDVQREPLPILLINGMVQLAITALFKYYGVKPTAVIGYGAGEIAAAYAAEKIELKDAIQILYHYGRVLGSGMEEAASPERKLWTVYLGCSIAQLNQTIISKLSEKEKEGVSVSGIQQPMKCSVTGELVVLKKIIALAEAEKIGILGRYVNTYGIHSKRLSETMKQELIEALENIKSHPSNISMFSTSKFSKEGKLYTGVLDGSYWWSNMNSPVLYAHSLSQTVNFLPTDGKNILEIGLGFSSPIFSDTSVAFYSKDRIFNILRQVSPLSPLSPSSTSSSLNYNISFRQFVHFTAVMHGYNVTQKLSFDHLWESYIHVVGGHHTFQQLHSIHYDLPTHCWNHKYLRKLYKAKRNGLPGDVNIVKTEDAVYLEKMALMEASKAMDETIRQTIHPDSEPKGMIKSMTVANLSMGPEKKLTSPVLRSMKSTSSLPDVNKNKSSPVPGPGPMKSAFTGSRNIYVPSTYQVSSLRNDRSDDRSSTTSSSHAGSSNSSAKGSPVPIKIKPSLKSGAKAIPVPIKIKPSLKTDSKVFPVPVKVESSMQSRADSSSSLSTLPSSQEKSLLKSGVNSASSIFTLNDSQEKSFLKSNAGSSSSIFTLNSHQEKSMLSSMAGSSSSVFAMNATQNYGKVTRASSNATLTQSQSPALSRRMKGSEKKTATLSSESGVLASEDDRHWTYENNKYLVDHQVNHQVVFPAAGSVSRALYGYMRSRGYLDGKESKGVALNHLEFTDLTIFQKNAEEQLKATGPIPMKLYEDHQHQFVLKHSNGSVISKGTFTDQGAKEWSDFPDLSEVIKSCSTVKGGEGIRKNLIYQRARDIELQYGPEFQLIQSGRMGRTYSYAKIEVTDDHAQMICHPAVLDNCFHSIICLGLGCGNRQILPFKIKSFEMMNGGHFKAGVITCVSQLIYQDLNRVMVNLFVYDGDSQPLAKIHQMEYLVRKLKPIRPLEWQNVLNYEKVDAAPQKQFPMAVAPESQVVVLCGPGQSEEVQRHLISPLSQMNLPVYLLQDPQNHQETIQSMIKSGQITKENTMMIDLTLLEDPSLEVAFVKIQLYVANGLNFILGNIKLDHAEIDLHPEMLYTASNGIPGMLRAARSEARDRQMFSIQANTVEEFVYGLFSGVLSPEEPDVLVEGLGDLRVLRLIQEKTVPTLYSENFVSEPKLFGSVNRNVFRKTYGIPELGHHELDQKCVMVKVKKVSIQHNDALQTSYPELAEAMKGSCVVECVGTVVQVGSKVKTVKRGDFIFGLNLASQDYVPSTYVKVHQDLVFPLDEKDELKQERFISSVYVYTVALYLLNEIQAGESLLLSTNASDLMQALITLAQQKHIPVIIDDTSRKYSKSQHPLFKGLQSRMISFAGEGRQGIDAVRQLTGGLGVNYVIDAHVKYDKESMLEACLRPHGEYVKMANLDHATKKRTTHKVIQMSSLSPKQLAPLVQNVMEMIDHYRVETIDLKTYPLSKMNRAMMEIVSGRLQGKSCLAMEGEEDGPVQEDIKKRGGYECLPSRIFKEDKSYLVTGAFGGVGLRVSLWMQLRGARHIILTTSSDPKSKYNHPIVRALREKGVHVTIAKCDISKLEEVEKLFKETTPAIDGIFHFANKFGPRLIRDSSLQQFLTTYEPKAKGALNLHLVTQRGFPVTSFVLFSSVLDLLGNTGQIAYGAANSFLGNLVYYRRRKGLSGQCFSLPAMMGSGYLSQWKQDTQSREFSEVIEFLDSEDLPDILDFFLRNDVDPCLQLMSKFQLNSEYARHIAPMTNVLKYRIHPELPVPESLMAPEFPALRFQKVLEEKEKYILSKYVYHESDSSSASLGSTRTSSPMNRHHSRVFSSAAGSTGGESSSEGGESSIGESVDSEKTLRNGNHHNRSGGEKATGGGDGEKSGNHLYEDHKYISYYPVEDGIYCLKMKNEYMNLEYAEELGQAINRFSQMKKMKALIIDYEENFSKGLDPQLKEELSKPQPSESKINEIYKIYFHCIKLSNLSVPIVCCLNGEITDLNILIATLSTYRISTRHTFFYSNNNPINIKWMTEVSNAKNDTTSLKLIEQLEKDKIDAIKCYKFKYINDIRFNMESMKEIAVKKAKSLIQNKEGEKPIIITIEDVATINKAIKI